MALPGSNFGFKSLKFVEELGAMSAFTLDIARTVVAPPFRFAALLRELYKLGVLSLIIILVSGLTVGMVLGLPYAGPLRGQAIAGGDGGVEPHP